MIKYVFIVDGMDALLTVGMLVVLARADDFCEDFLTDNGYLVYLCLHSFTLLLFALCLLLYGLRLQWQIMQVKHLTEKRE